MVIARELGPSRLKATRKIEGKKTDKGTVLCFGGEKTRLRWQCRGGSNKDGRVKIAVIWGWACCANGGGDVKNQAAIFAPGAEEGRGKEGSGLRGFGKIRPSPSKQFLGNWEGNGGDSSRGGFAERTRGESPTRVFTSYASKCCGAYVGTGSAHSPRSAVAFTGNCRTQTTRRKDRNRGARASGD